MIERCHPILEIILIDSFFDGLNRHGEKFAKLLQQDLNFEQKGKIIDLLGFEIIENSIPYIEDPENLIIDESSFDYCLSKIVLSEILTEITRAPLKNMSARQKHVFKWGGTLKRSGKKIGKAADAQIGANRERLFGQGKGTVAGSLHSAGQMAKTRTLGGAALAGKHVVGAGLKAARGAVGLATGGARKLLSKGVMARGKMLQGSPYKSYMAQQRRAKAREDIQAYNQRHANVPGV